MAINMSAISAVRSSVVSSVGSLSSAVSPLTRAFSNTGVSTTISTLASATSSASTILSQQLQPLSAQLQTLSSAPSVAASLGNTISSVATQGVSALGQSTAIITNSPTLIKNAVSDAPSAINSITSFLDKFTSTINSLSNKIPNPLRNHNHYNYIITLGVLDISEVNNPTTYRNNGFQKIVFRSGGGQYDIRQRIYLEQNEDAEYFVEDLTIDALISPNEKTGVSLGTTVSFEVIEPYSMGKFMEALIAAAKFSGYNSFNNAPYCLKVEFLGWDEYGKNNVNYIATPYFIPIMITNVEFNVKESGSVYRVEAVPYSEVSLSSDIDMIKTDIKASGRLVHELLENGQLSVTKAINESLIEKENKTLIPVNDRYMILFPKDSTTISEAINGGFISPEGMGIASSSVSSLVTENPELRNIVTNRVSTRVNAEIYQILKSLATDTSRMNELGLSELEIDPNGGGTQAPIAPAGMYEDAIFRVARRNASAAQPVTREREYPFDQKTKITEIIQSVLKDSIFIRQQAREGITDSPILYRIETYTFMVDNPISEQSLGRNPRIYVYAVHPYVSDQSHYLAPNQKPTTTAQLFRDAVKEYNYFYTGKNEDILNFDINYNYSFFQAAFADFGQLTAGERVKTQSRTVAAEPTLNISPPSVTSNETNANPSLKTVTGYSVDLPRTPTNDATRQLALMMYNTLINSNVDMINADMKIWGDPYYLPTVLGNFSPATQSNMLTTDMTMNYLRNDVMIVVNFINPLDYEVNGSLMTFDHEVNPAFSGVYQVLGVTSQFQKGQFTQDVKLQRQRGQEINTTTTSERFVVVSQGNGTGLNTPQPKSSPTVTTSSSAPGTAMQNPAATLNVNGIVSDLRASVWSNASIASAANTVVSTVANPITSLSNVGTLLSGVPGTIRSVLSNVRINNNLTPRSGPQ